MKALTPTTIRYTWELLPVYSDLHACARVHVFLLRLDLVSKHMLHSAWASTQSSLVHVLLVILMTILPAGRNIVLSLLLLFILVVLLIRLNSVDK